MSRILLIALLLALGSPVTLRAQPDGPAGAAPAQDAWTPSMPRDYTRDKLTAADWVGPDGIVYPRWDHAGVVGGIPSGDWPVVGAVKWFPGSRDITRELQQAVDDAGRTVRDKGLPGGVILLPAGVYTLSEPITVVYDRVVIRGAGKGAPGVNSGMTKLMFALNRPADGKPWAVVNRFDGKVIRDSVVMVFGDPRYRMNNPSDPVQPNRTIAKYGLRTVDDAGKTLEEQNQRYDGVTQQCSYAQFDVRLFAKSFEGKDRVRVQSWVTYENGETVEGAVQEIADIEINDVKTDRPALVGSRRPNRRLGGHAIMDAAFVIIGDQWSHRNNRQFLAQPARRGDTVLQFENDVTIEENGGWQAGDMLIVRADKTPAFTELTKSDFTRQQEVTIVSVTGNRVEVDQPLRTSFPVVEGQQNHVSFATPRFPIDYVGLEDMVVQFPNRNDWISVFKTIVARNFWMRDVRVEDVGRFAFFMQEVKNGEIRDCEVVGAHWPMSGSTAYIGFAGCHDSLMENVFGVNQRHGPDFHGGAGNVIRNCVFSGSDSQWHNGYGYEHLIENVTVGGYAFGGGYGGAIHTPDSGGGMHSPPGPRNVVWNCDLFGRDYGVRLGGYQQGWIFAYNRIKTEKGPAFTFRDRQTDHLIIGNTIVMEDLFSPVVFNGSVQDRDRARADELVASNSGIDLIGNTIYGSNSVLSGSQTGAKETRPALHRSEGNRVLPPDSAAPRPDLSKFPMASVFEAQRQNPKGMPPKGTPLYNPDPAHVGEPDQLRVTGKVVAQVNFCRERDAKETPQGWLVETGKVFGERDGGQHYGWETPTEGRRGNRDGNILYDTCNVFSKESGGQWAIELPPGRYEVEIGLGDSRYPFWGTYNSYTPETTYYAVNDVQVNSTLLKDRDGHMDRYDTHAAVVTVGEDRRLTLLPGPKSNMLRIQFIRISEASADRK